MSARSLSLVAIGFTATLLLGCNGTKGIYTLYRNSMVGDGMRVHVATFDAADGDDYNRENCDIATHLFAEQPGVRVKYWCEKGPFQK